MNTPVQTEQAEVTAPAVFFHYEQQVDRARALRAGLGSVALHAAVLVSLTVLPAGKLFQTPSQPGTAAQRITPLIAPPSELTQTAPNRGPISKELNLQGLLPRPRIS